MKTENMMSFDLSKFNIRVFFSNIITNTNAYSNKNLNNEQGVKDSLKVELT